MASDWQIKQISLKERREALEAELDWLDQQAAIVQSIFNRRMEFFARQRAAAMAALGTIINEQMGGKGE